MKIDLSGKRAVVTGGSRGIGRAIALACAEAGAAVSICARGAEASSRCATRSPRTASRRMPQACDVADAQSLSAYIDAAAEALGGIDILVNNASGFGTTDDEAGWAAQHRCRPVGHGAGDPGGGAVSRERRRPARSSTSRRSRASAPRPARRPTARSRRRSSSTRRARRRCWRGRASGSTASRRARSSFPAAPGSGRRRQPAALRRDPAQHPVRPARPSRGGGATSSSSSPRRSPAGSPARRSRSMAASCCRPVAITAIPAKPGCIGPARMRDSGSRLLPGSAGLLSDIEKRRLVLALQHDVETVDRRARRFRLARQQGAAHRCVLDRRQQRVGGVARARRRNRSAYRGGISRPRANTATLMCGACSALPRPGTGPGLIVTTRKRPRHRSRPGRSRGNSDRAACRSWRSSGWL